MASTRIFKDTIKARAERDPEFRVGLLREAVFAFLRCDPASGQILLRDYIRA